MKKCWRGPHCLPPQTLQSVLGINKATTSTRYSLTNNNILVCLSVHYSSFVQVPVFILQIVYIQFLIKFTVDVLIHANKAKNKAPHYV